MKLTTILLIITTILSLFFISFSFHLSNQLTVSKRNIEDKVAELKKLKDNPPPDPILNYVFDLQKYDSRGSKSLLYKCYEPEKQKNMSEKEQFWYDANSHFPPYPIDNAEINIIQEFLKNNNKPYPTKICLSPVSNDYLVVSNTADIFRFNKDLSYDSYLVSDKYEWFDVVAWFDNGDLVYSPGGDYNSMIVYVFTNNNEDILLEYCENKPIKNQDENIICKNLNMVSSKSNYVPYSLLNERLMPSRF